MSKKKISGRTAAKKEQTDDQTPEEKEEEAGINALMSEIESDLRDEQLQEIWDRYKNLAIGALAALILGVAGFQYLQSVEANRLAEQANAFSQASEDLSVGNTETALETFANVSEQGGSYGALAKLKRAAVFIEQGDVQNALIIYRELSADTSVDPSFSDLATLLWALHGMETEDPTALENALAPLSNPSSPFTYSASELLAVLYASRGDMQDAIAILEDLLADSNTPLAIRSRAEELLDVYQSPNPAAPSLPGPVTTDAPSE